MDRRIPSLDGLRALSITLVIGSHLAKSSSGAILSQVDYGNVGVRIFFVISGFLITTLLLRERQKTGAISLSGFYARRLLRIAPAYYAFLLVMALMIPTGWILTSHEALAPAAAFYANYKWTPGTLGHTWSLAVEEQFYLIWPGALVWFGRRESVYGCIALLFLAPLFRELSTAGMWPTRHEMAFENVCDALAVGCLLALVRDRLWSLRVYRVCVGSGFVLLIPAFAILWMAAFPTSPRQIDLLLSVLNVGIAMCLDRYMRFPETLVGRVLNLAPIAWIGTLSYSLYLWQQPFMFNTLQLPLLVKVLGPFACAAASYYWIERPGLALRRKLRISQDPVPPIPESAAA